MSEERVAGNEIQKEPAREEQAAGQPSPTVTQAAGEGVNFVTGSLSMSLQEAIAALEGLKGAEPLAGLLTELVHTLILQQLLLSEHLFINDLLGLHPDALSLRADSAFKEWTLKQPPLIQACLIHSQNPEDAAWAISLYKEERLRARGELAKREEAAAREAKLKTLASPTRAPGAAPRGGRFTREEIARMSVADFKKNEAEINAALAVGEIA